MRKVKFVAVNAIERVLLDGFGEARVSDIADFGSNVLKYGVAWASIGAVDTDKAHEFASDIMTASEFAQVLNDMDIEKVYDGDTEGYKEIVQKLEPVVEERKTWLFKEAVESIIKEYEIREEQ